MPINGGLVFGNISFHEYVNIKSMPLNFMRESSFSHYPHNSLPGKVCKLTIKTFI